MKKDLGIFLFLQILCAGIAVGSFYGIEIKWQAALVAGSCFVALGAWMVLKTLRWQDRFRYFSFYLARIYLWFFAFPMLLIRIRFLGRDFGDIRFFLWSGPEFHKWSEIFYVIMVIGTIVDLFRLSRSKSSSIDPI